MIVLEQIERTARDFQTNDDRASIAW